MELIVLFIVLLVLNALVGNFTSKVVNSPTPKKSKPIRPKPQPEPEDLTPYQPSVSEPSPIRGNPYMPAQDKRDYLNSPEWFTIRSQVLARDKCCQSCGLMGPLECHHITYARLGAEDLEDLKMLCRECHQEIHNRLGYDRNTIFNLKEQ